MIIKNTAECVRFRSPLVEGFSRTFSYVRAAETGMVTGAYIKRKVTWK